MTLKSLACPSLGTEQGVTWKFYYNPGNGVFVFAKVGDDSGYYRLGIASGIIRVHFYGPGAVTFSSSPSELGFIATSDYNITENTISTELNQEVIANGNICQGKVCMWNVTIDSGNTCAGIYISGTDFGLEICPFAGNVTYSPTCKYNTCYPCDCDCATCFGPNAYLCSSCPAGRYLHPIQLNCARGCSEVILQTHRVGLVINVTHLALTALGPHPMNVSPAVHLNC